MKEISMTIPQFLAYERGEMSIKDIKQINGIETLAGQILNDKHLTKLVVFTIAALNYPLIANASEEVSALGKIDAAGVMFLGIMRTLGYWLCIIFCIVDILKRLMEGNTKDIANTVIKYLCVFAVLYILPEGMNLIKILFK